MWIETPHGSRFREALAIINPGACNPSGVALSIADAYCLRQCGRAGQWTRYRDRAPKAWKATENTVVAEHFSETPKSLSPGNSAHTTTTPFAELGYNPAQIQGFGERKRQLYT